jgi:16S rRNA (cytidine1402-2'-O)-methyltransferase
MQKRHSSYSFSWTLIYSFGKYGPGMNGQSFTFMATCLLKRRKKASFKTLERISFEKTNLKFSLKYRNNKLLEDLIQTLHPETHLYCYGHYFTYRIHQNQKIAEKETIDLHKRPTIFIIHKM